MFKKLYSQVDFLNLTSEDVIKIKNVLEMDISKDRDQHEFLFKNIDIIEGNEEASKIINNKVLAGQVTVKWYRYKYNENITKEVLRDRLESTTLGYNVDIKERIELGIINDIVSIVSNDETYIIKILMKNGYKRYNNGIESKREMILKSIIVKIDIENCWIEVRANDELSKKIVGILESKLGLSNLRGVRILNNYEDNINTLKDDLIDGFYMNYKAAPSEVVELTEEDGVAIASIIGIIDEYFEDKDCEKLSKKLNEINYDTEGLSLSTILLAGVDNLGMKIRNDSEKDMSIQTLYTILKDDFIEDTSYIKFAITPNGMKHTMRVGLKSNSIVFKSSVTEDVIDYIRNKVL